MQGGTEAGREGGREGEREKGEVGGVRNRGRVWGGDLAFSDFFFWGVFVCLICVCICLRASAHSNNIAVFA